MHVSILNSLRQFFIDFNDLIELIVNFHNRFVEDKMVMELLKFKLVPVKTLMNFDNSIIITYVSIQQIYFENKEKPLTRQMLSQILNYK